MENITVLLDKTLPDWRESELKIISTDKITIEVERYDGGVDTYYIDYNSIPLKSNRTLSFELDNYLQAVKIIANKPKRFETDFLSIEFLFRNNEFLLVKITVLAIDYSHTSQFLYKIYNITTT